MLGAVLLVSSTLLIDFYAKVHKIMQPGLCCFAGPPPLLAVVNVSADEGIPVIGLIRLAVLI